MGTMKPEHLVKGQKVDIMHVDESGSRTSYFLGSGMGKIYEKAQESRSIA